MRPESRFPPLRAAPALAAVLALGLALSGCARPDPATVAADDPYEAANRRVHALNTEVDRAVLRPASQVYGTLLPEPVRTTVGNFAGNLDQPRLVVNDLLQGRVEDAVANTFRFLVNSTFGLAGLLDPATDMGLHVRRTDFGETLHVWGAPEGAYLVLPLTGPSTQRDAAGATVDFVFNPLRFALSTDENRAALGVGLLSRIGDRYRFSTTVDSLLYESADSYAQMRLIYLQNRRFALGGAAGESDYDPYEDPYAD